MDNDALLTRLKRIRTKLVRRYNQEGRYQCSFIETTPDGKQRYRIGCDETVGKSVGIQIGLGNAMTELDKLIRELKCEVPKSG